MMCDAATTEMIRDEVLKKVSLKEPFTAWDITVEVRKKGAKARHAEMKKVVHSLFRENGVMPDFTRVAVVIPGVAVPPWLYHPEGYDPKNYIKALTPSDDDDDGNDVKAPSSSGPTVTKHKTIAKNDDGSYDRQVGKEGYLYVPSRLISEAGWSHGDTVHVYDCLGKLVISLDNSRSFDEPVASCLVDSKRKVRLHKRFLGQIVSHRAYVKDHEIVVEPKP